MNIKYNSVTKDLLFIPSFPSPQTKCDINKSKQYLSLSRKIVTVVAISLRRLKYRSVCMNTIRMFSMFQLEWFSCFSQRKSEAIPVLPRLTNFFTILLKNFNTYNHQSGTFKLIKKLASWKLILLLVSWKTT